jgi:predicted NBD/HSP70 family sugar kinase
MPVKPTGRKPRPATRNAVKVLVIDVGGTNVKLLVTGKCEVRKFPSGPELTPRQLIQGVKANTSDWEYDVVTIGCPGPVVVNRITIDPVNLGVGWKGFDFAKALGRPVKLVNDAAMQAIGSYKGGRMLFLGLGTGLGTAAILEGVVAPMELAHLPYRRATFETYLGVRGMKRLGKKRWRMLVDDVVSRLQEALQMDYIVLGGGHVKFLKTLPEGCQAGSNANAFTGGFRLWKEPDRFVLGQCGKKR